MEFIAIIANIAFQNMLPVVGTVVAAITGALVNNLRNKVKVEKGVKAQEALDKVVLEVVGSLNQTIVGDIKRAKRKLKPEDVKRVRGLALANTKQIVANSTLKDVTAVVDDIDNYILNAVEATIGRQKLINQEKEKK